MDEVSNKLNTSDKTILYYSSMTDRYDIGVK
jgi:hypothetical protein